MFLFMIKGAMEENYIRVLEVARGELNLAWSLMEYRIDNYLLKGNELSALGEVAFRRGLPLLSHYLLFTPDLINMLKEYID